MAQTVTVNIVGDPSKLKNALKESDGALDKFGSSVGTIGASIAKFGALAATAIGVAGTAIAGFGLKAAADMQQVSIAFEGIFQSGEKAQGFLQELRDFAAKTPFEFPELARASKMLLATGIAAEDVIPIMTALGNVAATLGVGGAEIEGVVRALGQMKGKGKASAEELQQISEQIPGFSAIKAIAEELGITVEEAFDKMKDGAISADVAFDAIIKGMEKFPGAAGAMERQSRTLNGVLSTLKDTARDALIRGVSPALDGLASAVNQAIPTINKTLETIGKTFGELLTKVTPLIDKLLPVIGRLADIISEVLSRAIDHLLPLLDEIAPLFDAFLDALEPVLDALVDGLGPVLETLAPAVLRVATAFATALTPMLRDVVAPLLLVVADSVAHLLDAIGPEGATVLLAVAGIAKVAGALSAFASANPLVFWAGAAAIALGGVLSIFDNTPDRLQPSKEAIEGVTNALREQHKVMGEQFTAELQKQFAELDPSGAALRTLTNMGLTLEDLAGIFRGGTGSIDAFIQRLKETQTVGTDVGDMTNQNLIEVLKKLGPVFGAAGEQALAFAVFTGDAALLADLFSSSLQGLTDSIGTNAHTFEVQKGVVGESAVAAKQLTAETEALYQTTLKQTGSTEEANAKLTDNAKRIYEAARASGVGEESAAQYTAALLGIPGERITEIHNDADLARVVVEEYQHKLAETPEEKTTRFIADVAQARADAEALQAFLHGMTAEEYHVVITTVINNPVNA